MSLPDHRRAIHGRTHSSVYQPASFAAIERQHVGTFDRWAGVALAVAVGVALAFVMVEALA